MTKTRLITLLLTLALALASTSAVLAQEESPAPEESSATAFDPASVEEWNEDEALILYQQLEEYLLLAGVAEEDIPAAVDYIEETYGNLSPQDVEELLAAQMLADSDADMGDDEFGQAEGDEPELGDDEMGDDDEEEDDE